MSKHLLVLFQYLDDEESRTYIYDVYVVNSTICLNYIIPSLTKYITPQEIWGQRELKFRTMAQLYPSYVQMQIKIFTLTSFTMPVFASQVELLPENGLILNFPTCFQIFI